MTENDLEKRKWLDFENEDGSRDYEEDRELGAVSVPNNK